MLPDLDRPDSAEILPDNIRAIGVVYFASLLEEMRVFQVADRLAELFQQGLLPLRSGTAVRRAQDYYRAVDARLSAAERTGIYSRVLGMPGGDEGDVKPNQEFQSLWLRFIASVAMCTPKLGESDSMNAPPLHDAAARHAACGLAVNASRYGDALACTIAKKLASEIDLLFALLGDPEIAKAFAVRSTALC